MPNTRRRIAEGSVKTAGVDGNAKKTKGVETGKGTPEANGKASSLSKRKITDDSQEEEEGNHSKDDGHNGMKKSRKATAPEGSETRSESAPPLGGAKMDTLAPEDFPKNTSISDPLVLDNTPKPHNTTRIASWNILSFKSSLGKGLLRYIEAEGADVLILTETKCNDVPMHPKLSELYPHQTWGIGKTKGYAGIAMLSRIKPVKTYSGISGSDADTKGRIITAEFEHYTLVGTYVVNAGEGLKSLEAKKYWNKTFAEHLASCDANKPTIWTGDLNVVLDARDLSNASKKWNKSPGYTQVECDHHRQVLDGKAAPNAQPYVDIWRERHPDAVGHYTYYGFRGQCRQKGIGWRLDSFIVPQRIQEKVINCEIRHTVYGASDHVPVYLDIQGTL